MANVCDQVNLKKVAIIYVCLNTRVSLKLEGKQKSKGNVKNIRMIS